MALYCFISEQILHPILLHEDELFNSLPKHLRHLKHLEVHKGDVYQSYFTTLQLLSKQLSKVITVNK